TVTLTVVDVNGNSSSATAMVTVNDVTAAQVITQNISIDLDANGNASIVPADVDNGSNDACGIASMTVVPNTFDCSNIGANTVTLTVVDVNGNSSSATATVTVNDVTPAQVITQNISVDLDANGNASIVPADVDNGSNDACGIASMTVVPNTFDCSNIGVNTVTLTVVDVNGNSSSATAVVSISDNTDPVIVCAADATRGTDLGECTYTIQGNEFDATFTDNCNSSVITNSINGTASLAGEVFVQGATVVTWIVDDGHGQTASCTTTITVEDNEAPIVDCINIQVLLDASGNGSITIADINNNSTDNCGIASVTLSQNSFDCSDIGGDLDELIISEYIDGAGNNDCIEIYNGTGNPINLYAEGYTLRFYYNGSTSYTQVPLLGTVADREVYVICNPFGPGAMQADQTGNFGFDGNDAIALNKAGNAIDVIGQIGVNPGTGWTVGSNSTAGTTLVRNKDVLYGNINDISGIGSEWTQYAQNTTSYLGVHEIEIADLAKNIILTVTDTSGNVSTCEANVTVIDHVAPVALCQSVTIQLDANGMASVSASQVDNGSNDACGIASLVLDKTDFTCVNLGDNTVTLTVTDNNGNTSSCEATITVEDKIHPTVMTQDLTIQLDVNGSASIAPSEIDNGSFDNCGLATQTVTPNTFDCSNIGANTVTLSVTDTSGNVSTGTATVTVEDKIAPIAICKNITVELDINGVATITGADVDNGSNDACGIASLEVSPSVFGCADIGTNEVTLTVTDNNGNVSTCNATVTVTGIIPVVTISQGPLPEFCQGAVLVLTAESDEDFGYLWTTGETTQSIEISGNGTYGVTVTSLTNCSTEAEITVTGFNAGALVSSYTIIASEKAELRNNVIVQTGGVGVTGVNGEIKLDKASHIVGLGQARKIEIKQGSSVGTSVIQAANPTIPAFVYNAYSTSNSPDVRVSNNQTVTLSGGIYNKVEVDDNATVIFTAPNVYINELKTKKRATIEFNGCTNMFLNKEFKLDENGMFNSNGFMVTVYVNEIFEVKKGSRFTGRVHTNNHDIKVEGHISSTTYMTGMFIGKKVDADRNVVWNADQNCEPCPIASPLNNGGSEPNSNYTIIAFDEVHLHGDNIVQTGGVGVTRHNKKIKLHNNSHITEFAKASQIQVNGGSSIGTRIHSPAEPIIPLFVKNVYSNSNSPNATINSGQTVTLTGGVYDKVDVKGGATVIFAQSNVYINELKTSKHATIKFSGCTNVLIKKELKLDDHVVINPEGHKVIFYVDGAVEIGKGSVVTASIYAYNDEIKIDGSSSNPVSMKGLFIAKKVHANEDVIWNKDTSGSPCTVGAPTAQAFVTPEVGNRSIELISVKAWPNPSDTVFNLKLITENQSDIVSIAVFDSNNKLVHTNTFQPEAVYQFGNELESGVYVVKVTQAGSNAYTRVIKF
ncbi:lamin tail domain-containing protein, partial [Gelidibacter sp.]|uniref:lamin tail domain-containing protein n=1 Tax=Gelidibacter sp. TaxID=2018083 RepID=UPI003264FE54